MRELNVSVNDLSRETGYTKQHIYDLLASNRRWNETTLDKVCDVLRLKLVLIDEITNNPVASSGGEAHGIVR
ncbi:MAG: XRE family transcriptional regulator [Desulforudis sp.]|jgi:hypothetical protein|nr:MAG: XRE family transcriptional regulator [Desulforudis sp.]